MAQDSQPMMVDSSFVVICVYLSFKRGGLRVEALEMMSYQIKVPIRKSQATSLILGGASGA